MQPVDRRISRRLAAVGRAALFSFGILVVSSGSLGTLLAVNALTTPGLPWAIPVMGAVLVLGWRWLDGDGAPTRTKTARHELLRARTVPRFVFAWSLAAGLSSVLALAGLWIVLVQVVPMPPNASPDFFATYPPVVAVLALVTASLVSPLAEEAGFRGYAQVTLERVFSGRNAVVIAAILFAIAHVTVASLELPKLFVYFLVGLSFGTIAYRTRSTLPALPVHIAGDMLFFSLVWPNDAARRLVWDGGANSGFFLALLGAVVFGGVAILAFRGLAHAARGQGDAPALATSAATRPSSRTQAETC